MVQKHTLTCKPACTNSTPIPIFHPCALPEGTQHGPPAAPGEQLELSQALAVTHLVVMAGSCRAQQGQSDPIHADFILEMNPLHLRLCLLSFSKTELYLDLV